MCKQRRNWPRPRPRHMEDDGRMECETEGGRKRGGGQNRIGESNRAAESGTKIERYKQAEKKEEKEKKIVMITKQKKKGLLEKVHNMACKREHGIEKEYGRTAREIHWKTEGRRWNAERNRKGMRKRVKDRNKVKGRKRERE